MFSLKADGDASVFASGIASVDSFSLKADGDASVFASGIASVGSTASFLPFLPSEFPSVPVQPYETGLLID
jgi:hypothetical protein